MPKRVEIEGKSLKIAPKGHFVVYVGNEMTRFVLPMYLLKNPLFQQLLDRAAEEYGFHDNNNANKIILPCDEADFMRLIAVLTK